MNLFGDIAAGAHFDDTRTNRYCLWRQWDSNKPYLMVIGLNPSTANENTDDHTIKRIQGIAKFNDYGGIYMTNLFSYISTDPKKLMVDTDPDYNYRILACYAFMSKAVCFAWGRFEVAKVRAKEVEAMFPNALCLLHLKDGSPTHPLLIPYATKLIPYKYEKQRS